MTERQAAVSGTLCQVKKQAWSFHAGQLHPHAQGLNDSFLWCSHRGHAYVSTFGFYRGFHVVFKLAFYIE